VLITLDDIFGQEAAVQVLRASLQQDRLPHGLIFAGPVGVGKATTASAVAAAFLCQREHVAIPCGQCKACEHLAHNKHPDLHVARRTLIRLADEDAKARDFSVQVVREYLIEPAGRTSVLGRGKVFVVEEAELMNSEAQNALLKTLEEPQGRTLLILLTDRPDALLPTIRSRCRMICFGPLSRQAVQRELERRNISPTDAAYAARFADGSLGLALRWVEDGVVPKARELESLVQNLVGGKRIAGLPAWLRDSAKAYADKQLERDGKASADQATREGVTLYLGILARLLRTRLWMEPDPGAKIALCDAIEAVVRAENYIDANVGIPLALLQLDSALERRLVGS